MGRIRYELEYEYVPAPKVINDLILDEEHPLKGADQIVAITWDQVVGAYLVAWEKKVFVDGQE